ncbi:hypothetical protein EB118_02030 [bacterium]|nr:hypothetical protein [bacterium]NDC94196.1 hypothetical protein [bacterium]NDD83028.1 hypothetical protein [bacterium]NDG28866.1 hypothetical protein [bacterium]
MENTFAEYKPYEETRNILQQPKSYVISNVFLKGSQSQASSENGESKGPVHIFFKSFSDAILGFLGDLLNPQDGRNLVDHLSHIVQKDNRYFYIGILFVFIALFFVF